MMKKQQQKAATLQQNTRDEQHLMNRGIKPSSDGKVNNAEQNQNTTATAGRLKQCTR
jgi:hypothetical protein